MIYVLDIYWKGIRSDYEHGRLTPLSYSLDIYCRSILAGTRYQNAA